MKKQILFLTALVTLSFTACKKNKETTPLDQTTGSSYQPLTTGSTWTYRNTYHIGGGGIDTTTFAMLPETKKVGDQIFHILKSQNNDQAFFQNDGAVYRTLQEDIKGGDGLIPLEYLRSDAIAGTSWTNENGEYLLKTTIVERNLTKVIFNHSYNDVIHSTVEIQAKTGGVFKTQLIMDFYAAKGIGMIQTSVSTTQTEISRSELISSVIR